MRSGSIVVRTAPRLGGDTAIRNNGLKPGTNNTYLYDLESWHYESRQAQAPGQITAMRKVYQWSSGPCELGAQYGYDGSNIWVTGGCRAQFEVDVAGTGTGTTTLPDYGLADRNVRALTGRIQACQVNPNVPLPQSWQLAPPPSSAPREVIAAYDSYAVSMQELALARDSAGVFCNAGTNNGGVSSGAPTSGAPSNYGQSFQSGGVVDLYGGGGEQTDIYTPTGGMVRTPSEGGSTVVANPFAPQPTVAAKPKVWRRKSTIAMAGGGAVVIFAAALFLTRKRKSKSRR